MSEELLQRDLLRTPDKIGPWSFYNIGSTSVKALKEHGIIRDVSYGLLERKKVDGIVVEKQNVIAIIEYKKPSEFRTKTQQQKAVDQEIAVAQRLCAPLLIATDTKETVWVNVATGNRIKDDSGKELRVNFNPKDEKLPSLIEKIRTSISEDNDQIKSKVLVNPTSLAKQIWQDIWSVSGATPENCLYTFVELFIFKYLSDLGVLHGMLNFHTLYGNYKHNTDDEVLDTYANMIRPKIKDLFPQNTEDKTTIINGTIFVSKDQAAVRGYSAVFKKVLGKFNDYGKLEHIHHDFKSQLFESFLKESISKKNWGQYFTPLKVVRAIVSMAKDDIKAGANICDPACGVGKFLLEPILSNIDQFYEVKKGKLVSKITLHGYDKGFDKDEQKTIILAKANMLIYFSDLIRDNPKCTKEFSTLFNDTFLLKTNSILGTLSETIENKFDLILTNPPYVTSGTSNLKEEIKKSGLEHYYTQNGTGIEGLFVEWIVKALKPGGKAFVVIPDGILRRTSDQQLRKYLLDQCFIDAIISLPEKTFFTTLKKTYILCFTKKLNPTQQQTEPALGYLASSIGETLDIYRMETEENNLDEATILFNQFKSARTHFKPTSRRCKIITANWLLKNVSTTWIIENLWKEPELIKLGIKEKDNAIKVSDFSSALGLVAQAIADYQAQLDSFSSSDIRYRSVRLGESKYFELISGALGLKKDQYVPKDTAKESDVPVYTAKLEPVAHFKSSAIKRPPFPASEADPHISFASDGDGTAGTNIVFHSRPYYINTSRIAFRVVSPDVDARYVFFAIQDIKKRYGFDFKHKATIMNAESIEIKIPIDEFGKFDLAAQKELAQKSRIIRYLKNDLHKQFDRIANAKLDLE